MKKTEREREARRGGEKESHADRLFYGVHNGSSRAGLLKSTVMCIHTIWLEYVVIVASIN